MGLQEIGYGGQPLPKVFRPVHPATPVLIDLVALFPREPHGTGRYHPNGLQMEYCWVSRELTDEDARPQVRFRVSRDGRKLPA